ncbi:hypothetical protein UF75_2733 [Desulfosporosinus sp. I2]|nr:hypothetical protein UF75_2733 [Desulfosporosinus sp. I2]
MSPDLQVLEFPGGWGADDVRKGVMEIVQGVIERGTIVEQATEYCLS